MKFPPYSRFRHPSSPNVDSDVEKQSPPDTKTLQKWNTIFIYACLAAISVDPLFLYILLLDEDNICLKLDKKFEFTACVLRTAIDVFYLIRMFFQYTEFTNPNPNPYGGGEVVQNPRGRGKGRYLTSYFILDLLSILPLPQLVVLLANTGHLAWLVKGTINIMEIVIIVQSLPRFLRIYPLYKELNYTFGMIFKSAWAGAVSNLLMYLLASHVVGALWYMWAVQRGFWCWKKVCKDNSCITSNLFCRRQNETYGYLLEQCAFIEPDDIRNATQFNFGIFAEALASGVADSSPFPQNKFLFCIWWGLRNLSSMGQNLKTSTYGWETFFSIFISIAGLVLFALFIGNMQRYLQFLQTSTERIHEMRVKKKDEERWMSHRDLPDILKERIKKYRQYQWHTTRGAAEEQALIASFPKDLSRDINRHLALRVFARVPGLNKMDIKIRHALCDCLKPVLYSSESCIIEHGDSVNEMLFIMKGNLETETIDYGIPGSYSKSILTRGGFIGEALLNWALDPHSSSKPPLSTITVKTLSVVEAFTLEAQDLKSVASKTS